MRNTPSLNETLRAARNYVVQGQMIPPTASALLEAWGYNVPALERRWQQER